MSFIGAIEVHGLMRSLFGREGPGENPKIRSEVFRRIVAIALWKDPEHLPQSRSKLKFLRETTGILQGKLDLLKVTGRGVVLLPAFSLKYMGFVVSIFILSHLVFGSPDFIAGLIGLSLFILFFRDKIWTLFPAVQHSPGETGLVKAEFERDRYESDGRNLGERLRKNPVSFRYDVDDRDE
jgi:hypothetical protein